MERSGIRETR